MSHNLPRLMTIEEVSEYLDVSIDTLGRQRAAGTGPNFIKVGQAVRYLESDILDYIQSQRQLPVNRPSSPEAMRAAVTAGSAERKAACLERRKEMQKLDADDRMVVRDTTVAPGMQQIINLPPIDLSA